MNDPGGSPELPSFAEVTAVTATSDGAFTAHLPASWSTPVGVHGGVLVAAGLRAALAAIDRPDLRLRTAHAVFLAAPDHDVTFSAATLREGRGSAHVRVTGTSGGRDDPVLDLTVVLTADAESVAFVDSAPPDVPGWDDARPAALGAGPPAVPSPPLFDNLEIRPVVGILPAWEGWVPDQPPRHVRWNRYRVPPARDEHGNLDPLMLLPVADLPGPSIWVRFGPDDPIPFFLSLELSITFLEPFTDDRVLTDIRARWLGRGHAWVETDLWVDGRLVATSTQTMLRRR